ncbi:hypothetical protein [Paracoccus sp. N5]|uniref:hypothetical protein n=1 Tax=Paracoccus sp. N5 TaxID=1101189 RepID=UPI0018DEE753|nr:hypothetical protein [Paracoccus sp. N5]
MREAPVGISWTTLFFGFIPALLRSDWVGAVIQLVIAFITFGLSGLIFMFLYNKMYLKRLLNEGFEVTGGTGDVDYIQQRLGLQLQRAVA